MIIKKEMTNNTMYIAQDFHAFPYSFRVVLNHIISINIFTTFFS